MSDYNRNKNVSTFHQFIAYVLYEYRKIYWLFTARIYDVLTYRKTYRNYASILVQILKHEYPIEAISRTGKHIRIKNSHELYFVTRPECVGCKDYDIFYNKVSISVLVSEAKSNMKLDFYDHLSNGDFGVFFNKQYGFLPVEGKTVLDIGANIGNSCIYFALRGSSRIVAIEPFPRNYQLAKKKYCRKSFCRSDYLSISRLCR